MKSIERTKTVAALRVAFYARVSTEDQAERATIQSQLEYLRRKYAPDFDADAIEPMEFAGEFKDEGYSGTLPLEDRPDGQRLLDAMRAGMIDMVVVYRLDRLGRSIKVLLDAHEELDKHGVAIVSATEPFDTRTPIGRFVFQLLGSIAELERNTIRERMALGRDRVARAGRFINGAVPFGYDLDADDRLVPSTRIVSSLEMSEAEVARQIFTRVAGGESAASVTRWLNALGIPATTRYRRDGGPTRETYSGAWRRDRVADMIHTSLYRGVRVLNHASGDIEQDCEPIVDDLTWQRANSALSHVTRRPLNKQVYSYLLSGKIRCALCDSAMIGNFKKDRDRLYYVCIRAPGREQKPGREPCRLPSIMGNELEEKVLSEIDAFFADPQGALEELRQQLRTRQGDVVDRDVLSRRLHARLREADLAKRDILELVKRRRLSLEEADAQLDELAGEVAQIRGELEGISNQQTLTEALEMQLIESAAMLTNMGKEWKTIRRANDREQLRVVVKQLVVQIWAYPDQVTRRRYTLGTPAKTSTVDGHSTEQATTLDARLLVIERGAAA